MQYYYAALQVEDFSFFFLSKISHSEESQLRIATRQLWIEKTAASSCELGMDPVTFAGLFFKDMKAAEIMHTEHCIYLVLLQLTTGKNVIAAGPSEMYHEY